MIGLIYLKELGNGFKYEPHLCNGCHDLMQKAVSFNDVTIVSVKGNDFRIHFWYMSNNVAINIMKRSNLNEKSGWLQIFSSYKKQMIKLLVIKETEKKY